jgi:hypothetical protein
MPHCVSLRGTPAGVGIDGRKGRYQAGENNIPLKGFSEII